MSAPRVSTAEMVKVARNLGAAGRPLPEQMRDNPAFVAAHDQGAAERNGVPFHPVTAPRRKTASRRQDRPAAPRPRRRGGRARISAGANRAGRPAARAFSPTAAAKRLGAGKLVRSGDAGGLLLALVVYPIVLATVRHGAAGPMLWFKAKWLNQTPGDEGGPAIPDPLSGGGKLPAGTPGYNGQPPVSGHASERTNWHGHVVYMGTTPYLWQSTDPSGKRYIPANEIDHISPLDKRMHHTIKAGWWFPILKPAFVDHSLPRGTGGGKHGGWGPRPPGWKGQWPPPGQSGGGPGSRSA